MNRMLKLLCILVVAPVCLAALGSCGPRENASVQAGPSWPRWRGPEDNGISRETGWDPGALAEGPKVRWTANLGNGHSDVVIQAGRLYTMGRKDDRLWVYSLAADSGRTIWRYSFPEGAKREPQSTPALDDSHVFCLDFEGALVCLNARNGKLVWKKDLVSDPGSVRPYYGFAASPVVEGSLVILAANSSGIALDRTTGKVIWTSPKPPKADYGGYSTGVCYATPVVYQDLGKKLVVIASHKGIQGVEAETGKIRWLFDWQKDFALAGDQIADPVIFDNKLFFAQFYNYTLGCALLDVGGEAPRVLWENRKVNSETASPVLLDGYLYVCNRGVSSGSGSLLCLDPADGRMIWEEKFSGKPISLTAADGKLIVLDARGNLVIGAAAASGFRTLSSCMIPAEKNAVETWWTTPVLCGGRIYCRSHSGYLVCIDVSGH